MKGTTRRSARFNNRVYRNIHRNNVNIEADTTSATVACHVLDILVEAAPLSLFPVVELPALPCSDEGAADDWGLLFASVAVDLTEVVILGVVVGADDADELLLALVDEERALELELELELTLALPPER